MANLSDVIEMEDRTVMVNHYDAASRIYLASGSEFIAGGIGLPANSTTIEYNPPEGEIGFFGLTQRGVWDYKPDYSLLLVRDIKTGYSVQLPVGLTELPDNVTTVPLSDAKIKLLASGKFFMQFIKGEWVTYPVLLGKSFWEKRGAEGFTVQDRFFIPSAQLTAVKPSASIVGAADQDTIPLFNDTTQKWELLQDYTGILLYSKETAKEVKLNEWLTQMPDMLTNIMPPSLDATWDDDLNTWSVPPESLPAKAKNIIMTTDKYFTIPDYQLNGATITDEQRRTILAYRAELRLVDEQATGMPAVPDCIANDQQGVVNV